MKHRTHQFFFLSTVIGMTAVLLTLAGPIATGIAQSASGAGFSIQSSPSPDSTGDTFLAASAISTTSVWAVGYKDQETDLNEAKTLTEHWNGTAWAVVPSPNPNPGRCSQPGNVLTGVSALSGADVWAVGFSNQDQEGCSQYKPLILNWNGASWRAIPNPPLSNNGSNVLNGVAALASGNVYAVGYQNTPGVFQATLIENWNGQKWQAVPTPNVSSATNSLTAITAISPDDIWAVGYSGNDMLEGLQTLALHFNGSEWSVVPTPNPVPPTFGNRDFFLAVTAASSDSVTAVGYSFNSSTYVEQTLIEHWDGSTWSVVPSPNPNDPAGAINTLNGLVALSPSDVYAAGFYTTPYQAHPLIEHFNGAAWSIISSPTKGAGQNLNAITSPPGTSFLWAVGAYSSSGWDYDYDFLVNLATLVLFQP